MPPSGAERETVIVRTDDEDKWTVYSCSLPMVRRLRKYKGHPDVEIDGESLGVIELRIPKNWVRIRPAKRRKLSDAARKAAGERLRKARQDRQNG